MDFRQFRRTHAQHTPVLGPCSERQRRQENTRLTHARAQAVRREKEGTTRTHTPVPRACSAREKEINSHAHAHA